MAKEVKCKWCEKKDSKELMVGVEVGKKTIQIIYYHKDSCYNIFLQEKEQKKKDFEEFSNLCKVIQDIHEFKGPVNNQFVYLLHDIRNGTIRKGQNVLKGKKDGVPYRVITEAYELNRGKIRYSKKSKEFTSELGELKYGLAIIKGSLSRAQKILQRKKSEENSLNNDNILNNITQAREIIYIKKERDDDISDLLGDY